MSLHHARAVLHVALLLGCTASVGCGGSGGPPTDELRGPESIAYGTTAPGRPYALFRTILGVGETNRLSEPAAGQLGTILYGWSPDHSHVAFVADQEATGSFELFVVTAAGTDARRVSIDMPTGTAVLAFAWSPDSQRIAYTIQVGSGDDDIMIRSVRADGTDDHVVSDAHPGDTLALDLGFPFWAPDGSRLAWREGQPGGAPTELYTSRPDGTDRVIVSNDPANESVFLFAWSPNGKHLAYVTLFDGAVDGLYVSDPETGATERITTLLTTSYTYLGDSHVHRPFAWSPNSRSVAYVSTQGGGVEQLWVEDVEEGEERAVSRPLVDGGAIHDFAWSPNPDVHRLAYSGETIEFATQLWSVAGTGGLSLPMSGTMAKGHDVKDFAWSPSGKHLAILGDLDTHGTNELFTVLDGGGAVTRVSGAVPALWNVTHFRWSPDSQFLAFLTATDGFVIPESPTNVLHVVRPGTTSPQILRTNVANTDLGLGSVPWFPCAWTRDSASVLYMAPDESFVTQVFRHPVGADEVQVTHLVDGGVVTFLVD